MSYVKRVDLGEGRVVNKIGGFPTEHENIIANDMLDLMEIINLPLPVINKMVDMTLHIPTVRLSIAADGSVKTMAWPSDGTTMDFNDRRFSSIHELPAWVLEKLAVLMTLNPTEDGKAVQIPYVGRRIDRNTFWIHPDEDYTGREGKEEGT